MSESYIGYLRNKADTVYPSCCNCGEGFSSLKDLRSHKYREHSY